MKFIFVIIFATILIGCSPSTAVEQKTQVQEPIATENANALDPFLGHWQSSGDAFGQAAISTMTWSHTLEGKFVRLDYAINAAEATAESSIFSGVAFYKMVDDAALQAFWADTTGDLHPIRATLKDNELISIWGIEGQKIGKTRYALGKDGRITVTDWIMREGEFKQFNTNVFSRVTSAAGN